MSNDKVLCQCCNKMMVPTVIKSQGLFVGWQWGWMLGGGHPVSSCCPFCLSENWNDPSRPVHKSVGQKTILMLVMVFGVVAAYGVFELLIKDGLHLDVSRLFDTVAQWFFVIAAVALYRRYRKE